MDAFWRELDTADLPEQSRLELFEQARRRSQLHIADMLRITSPT